MKTHFRSGALLCAFFFAQILSLLGQGSLTPPGAPAPTMKALDEIEPRINIQRAISPLPNDANNHFIISSPGSYYLTANLGATKANGIHVTAPDVTIDLNGFKISRSSGSGGDGISVDAAADRCTVKNGSIVGFGNGIECTLNVRFARGGRFSQLSVASCTSAALRAGEAWKIDGCTVHDNVGGVVTSSLATITDLTAYGNTSTVIAPGAGSVLTRCSANFNSASVIYSSLKAAP